MILSEQLRRWSEIQFYYFCMDLYTINKDMIDVILFIEAIAHIGNLDYKLLKSITGKMLGDPYYLPIKDEVICLAYTYGLSKTEISNTFNFNRKTISAILQDPYRNTSTHSTPLLLVKEDQELYKFNQIISQIKKAGINEKETKN